MKTRAAIAFEPNKPLEIGEVDLEGPREGECLVRLAATGVCHTDAFTLSGADPEGLFPTVLGHEGAGVVEALGPEVRGLAAGDRVAWASVPGSYAEAVVATRRTTTRTASIISNLERPLSAM